MRMHSTSTLQILYRQHCSVHTFMSGTLCYSLVLLTPSKLNWPNLLMELQWMRKFMDDCTMMCATWYVITASPVKRSSPAEYGRTQSSPVQTPARCARFLTAYAADIEVASPNICMKEYRMLLAHVGHIHSHGIEISVVGLKMATYSSQNS